MVVKIVLRECSLTRARFYSHISSHYYNLIQNRCIIKFPRIFDRRNPDLVSKASVNLHDQSTAFINFIKTLDSLVSSKDVTVESFIELFERFEANLSDDNDHILNALGSYDTLSLLLMLDSLTVYTQTKNSKNITNFMNHLCSVLAKRNLIKSEKGEFDIGYNMAMMDIINRINYESTQVKSLIISVNTQLRASVEFLIQTGNFINFMNLFSYTLDPKAIYTIVYCCLFKLDKFKNNDFANLPRFLFKFKIHDEDIISNLVSYSSTSFYSLFESATKTFGKFVKGLLLFESLYNNNDISFSPIVLYLNTLKSKLSHYNDDELLLLLSSLPSERHFVASSKAKYSELINRILVKIGVLSESNQFITISQLNNPQLIRFVKYVNKREIKPTGIDWIHVKSLLINKEKDNYTHKITHASEHNSFLNDFANDFSKKILKQVPQNCKLGDLDSVFKNLEVCVTLMKLLDKFYLYNVDEIYINSFSLSLRRLLSLMNNQDFEENELVDFFNNVSRLNIKLLADFSSELFNLGHHSNLEVFEKALRFKLLNLKQKNMLSQTSEIIQHFNSFEALKDNVDINGVIAMLNLIDLINKTKKLSDTSQNNEFDEVLEKFSVMVYDCLSNNFGLFSYKVMRLLFNLPADSTLLNQMDGLTDMQMKNVKIPQLVTIFIYKLRRAHYKKEELEKVKKLYEELYGKLEELIEVLETSFSQRIWLSEYTNNNNIKKANPWLNENGLRLLFKKPNEHFDMFLYEKCPRVGDFFDVNKYGPSNRDHYRNQGSINSLHALKIELIELSRQIGKEETQFRLKDDENGPFNDKEALSRLGSQLRRAALTVEMCRPISRDCHLSKKHTNQLLKLCHKRIENVNK